MYTVQPVAVCKTKSTAKNELCMWPFFVCIFCSCAIDAFFLDSCVFYFPSICLSFCLISYVYRYILFEEEKDDGCGKIEMKRTK